MPVTTIVHPPGSSGRGEVLDVRWGVNRVEAKVRVTAAPALLVIANTYRPGWRALIDARPGQVLRADGLVQAVWVEPGEHTVTLRYAPPRLAVGAAMSGASAMLLLGVATFRGQPASRGRRNRRT